MAKYIALFYLVLLGFVPLFSSRRKASSTKVKAVNLGGWLVTEGWIKPSLFDGISNKDLLDGTQVAFKSVTVGKYLCAESGGGTIIVANRTVAGWWEEFRLWRINETTFQLRVFNRQFIGIENNGQGINLVAVANFPGEWETFVIVRNDSEKNRVRIKAPNGSFLKVKSDDSVTADGEADSNWDDDDPSVFVMNVDTSLHGEYQITNGYGPEIAEQVMTEHWKSYIVEDDIKFISQSGLNAVRIPVGWWIASDPTPPKPFVGGSLKALDKAFIWAGKYGVKVIIDLHAAPGSQNGYEHSSSRDGFQDWGQTDENIQHTVAVIEFLMNRYGKETSFLAMELMNEPRAPGVSLDSLKKYYRAGYQAVRRHSRTAYVVMSNRLGPADPTELLVFAGGFVGSVVDVHYYNLYSDVFDNMTVEENINFVCSNRSRDLNAVTIANGPLTFVGEWVAEWQVRSSTKHDLQRFAQAEMEIYGRATFGWAYWTFKNVNHHWSMKWMIEQGYIKL